MANTPTSYPKVTTKAWRVLRERASQAPSTKFTPTVVGPLTGMASTNSALGNVVRPMRKLGIFDDDGDLTDIGRKWRVDASYADACQEIMDTVYPSDLAVFIDENGEPQRDQILAWFEQHGHGGSNAQQMAGTYAMIASKKLPTVATSSSNNTTGSNRKATTPKPPKAKVVDPAPDPKPKDNGTPNTGPNLHLDIQIHIPSDASPEQIDQIFASMAKHLYQ